MDLDTLNPAQRAAVTAPDGVQLVVAGAGTGKTRALVHRVAWLVERGVDPRDIVLLTFTRRAAREMLERAADLVGDHARSVRGGTYHSFAVTCLRRHADAIGYTRGFTVLDRADAESLVGLVRSEVGLAARDQRAPTRRTLHKLLSARVNTGRPMAELVERSYPQYLDLVADIERVAERYAERKREQGVMDFDDLLVRFVELLRDHPDRRRHLASSIRYLLVDEYQDTNRLQAEITGLLSFVHDNLMVVGDEAQSIYGFRGADVRNILDFQQIFPRAAVIRLEQNYRSTTPILELANGVLESAAESLGKVLFSDRAGGARPRLVSVFDEHDQAAMVVEQVLARRDRGVALREQAVLFRSGFHSNLLEVELQAAGVPFRKFGGLKFVEASHVRDVFALLRVVHNPRDQVAWLRVLEWFEGLGAKTATRIAEAVAAADGALDVEPYRKRKYGPALVHLAAALDGARAIGDAPEPLVEHLVAYYRPIFETLYEDHRKRARDLDTLGTLAARFTDVEAFLADVALDPPEQSEIDGPPDDAAWLTLSTIHSAKGLEWDAVTVLQLADGHFPSAMALGQTASGDVDDEAGLEEERRLLYVAVTRARAELDLVQPGTIRTRFGPERVSCRLLDDIPALSRRTERLRWKPTAAEPAKHPDIAAAEARLAEFMRRFPRKN
jgi:DNA helicase-2/ATP-dependent DNA helicase PcrA